MTTCSDVESIRGRKKLVDDGYHYVLDKSSKDGLKQFWRCDQKHNGCPVRLHSRTRDDEVIKRMHRHNHDRDFSMVQVNRLRTAVKRRVELEVSFDRLHRL